MAAILRAGHVDELSRVRPCGLSIDPSAPQPASATVGSAFPNSACSSTATIRAAKKRLRARKHRGARLSGSTVSKCSRARVRGNDPSHAPTGGKHERQRPLTPNKRSASLPSQQAAVCGKLRAQTSGTTMGTPVEILEAELLQLPKADRIRVLDRVVASLDADAARDAAWDAVAARRDAEADRDPSVLLDLDDVLAKLRAEVQ